MNREIDGRLGSEIATTVQPRTARLVKRELSTRSL